MHRVTEENDSWLDSFIWLKETKLKESYFPLFIWSLFHQFWLLFKTYFEFCGCICMRCVSFLTLPAALLLLALLLCVEKQLYFFRWRIASKSTFMKVTSINTRILGFKGVQDYNLFFYFLLKLIDRQNTIKCHEWQKQYWGKLLFHLELMLQRYQHCKEYLLLKESVCHYFTLTLPN